MLFKRRNSLFIGHFSSLLSQKTLVHGFSMRQGGKSEIPFDSLNLGLRTGDSDEHVRQNRLLFFDTLDIDDSRVVIPEQVHEDRVVYVDRPGQFKGADAVITDKPHLALSIQMADCVPVFLFDARAGCIGLVHAGWRSTAGQIVMKTVGTMIERCSAKTGSLYAAIGPSIGPCCFQVGPEVKSRFQEVYIRNGNLDLWQANFDQLISSGIPPEHIELCGICTRCNSRFFFSHRADHGQTGRMLAVMMIQFGH
jgi:YfiH family protein